MYRPTPFLPPKTEYDDIDALNADRHANDLRLKGTFESIFAKYERDFTDIGDEIDLETGELVVDNGHLRSMEDEGDTGESQAARFLRSYTEDLSGAEDGYEDVSGSGSEADLEGDEDDVREAHLATEEGAKEDEPAIESAVGNNPQSLLPPAAGPNQLQSNATLTTTPAPMAPPQPPNTDIEAIIQSSLQSWKQGFMSELAQFMQGNRQTDSKDDIWTAPPLPVVPRSARPTPLPQLPGFDNRMSQTPAPRNRRSIWAPTRTGRPPGSKTRVPSVRPRQVSSNPRSGQEGPRRSTSLSARRTSGRVSTVPEPFSGTLRYDAVNTALDDDEALQTPDGAVDPDPDADELGDHSAVRVTYSANTKRSLSGHEKGTLEKGRPYTQEQDALIIRLREQEGASWDKIAAVLGRQKKSLATRVSYIKARQQLSMAAHDLPVTSPSPNQGSHAPIPTYTMTPNGKPLIEKSQPPESGNAADALDEVGDEALPSSIENDLTSAERPQILFVPDSQTGDEQLSSSNPASSFQQESTVTRGEAAQIQTEPREPQAPSGSHEIVLKAENGPEQELLEETGEIAPAPSKKRKKSNQTSTSAASAITTSARTKRRKTVPENKEANDAGADVDNSEDVLQNQSRSARRKSPRVVIQARKQIEDVEAVPNPTDAEETPSKHQDRYRLRAREVRQRSINGRYLGKPSKESREDQKPRDEAVTEVVPEPLQENGIVQEDPVNPPTPSDQPIPSVETKMATALMPPPPPPISKAKSKSSAVTPPRNAIVENTQKQDRTSTPTTKAAAPTPQTPAPAAKAMKSMPPPPTPGIRASTPRPTVATPGLGRPGGLLAYSPKSTPKSTPKSSARRHLTSTKRTSLFDYRLPDDLEGSPTVTPRSSSRAPSRAPTPSKSSAANTAKTPKSKATTTLSQMVADDDDDLDDLVCCG